jgi:hypothetical protein
MYASILNNQTFMYIRICPLDYNIYVFKACIVNELCELMGVTIAR